MIDEVLIKDMLFSSPLSLLAIKDKQVIQYLNELVPYSTAFEIECDKAPDYNEECFKSIPNIMAVQNDSGEQRYRITNGLMGIICVYHISRQLKINSLLNPLSSIHYHCDCTDCFEDIKKLIQSDIYNQNYILSELDTWLVNDKASSRGMYNWFKLNNLQTIEFRLGEMTFDYKIIIKRIIHCNAIVKRFKDQLQVKPPEFKDINIREIIDYEKSLGTNLEIFNSKLNKLNRELQELTKEETKSTETLDTIKSIVKNRVHKI